VGGGELREGALEQERPGEADEAGGAEAGVEDASAIVGDEDVGGGVLEDRPQEEFERLGAVFEETGGGVSHDCGSRHREDLLGVTPVREQRRGSEQDRRLPVYKASRFGDTNDNTEIRAG